ncbi:phenoloxidase-activating factor 2-like [Musca vetustissima]|uniref:phenoloxidase-activating factor 2-like n=1 Tax=Musca vetustissima TaxID=27455 RepID=UPI002AB622B3|nr:phenoloxidase-activating factor 2-like [Musca vetustissima]
MKKFVPKPPATLFTTWTAEMELSMNIKFDPNQAEETQPIKCGQRNKEGILGALNSATSPSGPPGESRFGEFPWTIDITNNQKLICAGSLIHPKVVLTAGQCLLRQLDNKNLTIRAGLWDREDNNERYPYQERSIEKFIIHPEMAARKYDIALVFVNESFVLADHINTVCLPPANYVTPNGTMCYATGWGRQSMFGDISRRIKRVTLTSLTEEICEREMNTQLHSSVMCALGQNGNDTCAGDSGAPLVSRITTEEEVYHQIGITSFGAACFAGIPGGYTDVARLREWIDSQMRDNGLDITTYIHE